MDKNRAAFDAASEKPIIATEDLHFSYKPDDPDTPEVLKGVNISIMPGEFVAVLGHNGSGKSTLAKCLNGILMPTSGRVIVGGLETGDENNLFEIRKTAGMVFQNPDNQIVATVVEEDVAFAPENMGFPQKEIRRRVDESLKMVGMESFARHAPHLLSGGQKQRIAIAGVLAMEPRVMIMDEPTAMLDPSGRAEVMNAVTTLNRERGLTLVIITHHMDEAAMADRIIVMKDGEIFMEGKPGEIFAQREKLAEASLLPPQTIALLTELGLPPEGLSPEECAARIYEWLKGEDVK